MHHSEQPRTGHVVIGVDTHKHVDVAAVMDTIGGILATLTIPTDAGGFRQLADWAASFGTVLAFGIEGTGSYGATLTSFLRRAGHKVVEAGRPDRRLRRMNGKSDTLDAENAARAALAGFATATPKSADGEAEMIRLLKVAHDQAVEQRAAAMVTIKAMLVHASDALRQETAGKTQISLARQLAALRPRHLEGPEDALRHTPRTLAKRWQYLDAEAKELTKMIGDLVQRVAPQLLEPFGIGADTAAEILVVTGDNPERIKSEAALAKLAGIAPVPTGSGMTSGRHRINHGGHRAAERRDLPNRHRSDALPPADDRLRRPPHRRRQDETRDHPMPQALRYSRGLPPPPTHPTDALRSKLTTIGAPTPWPRL
ncbi:transposase [Streptomyces sp. NPDC093228]|uniref:IS110 family transposase n=1 Tax=Streptomyces sp. NPDC093228 TaxID=3155070 RepID=UPI003415640A